MFTLKKAAILLAVLLALPVFGQECGNPVFSDDFSSYQMSLENWKSSAGAKQSGGKIGLGSWESKFAIPPEFYVEVDVAFTSDKNPDGNAFAGLSCDNRVFGVTPDGYVFPVGGLPKTKIEGFKTGEPVHLAIARECGAKAAIYVFKVNGQEIARQKVSLPTELQEALAIQGSGAEGAAKTKIDWNALGVRMKPIRILASGADATADNFRLSSLKGGNEACNRVINSSFEALDSDGFPYYVFRSNANMFDLTSETLPYEKQIANWTVDDKEKHSGKHSVRLTYQKGLKFQCLWIWGRGLSVVEGQPAVLSVYLKADKPDFPVTLSLGGAKSEVMVGTDWARHSVTNPKISFSSTYVPMEISFKKQEGSLWVDDLQIEVGTEPTPYQPSPLDKQYLADKPEIVRPADIKVPKLAAGTVPTVDLDSWSSQAFKLEKFTVALKPAAAKSEAWIACDSDNLYVGLRAYVDDPATIKIAPLKHDEFGVFGGESMELMFDPLSDMKFWQFGVNAANSAADVGRGRIVTWGGDWKHVVKFNEKTRSFDYFIAMPFADFAMPSLPAQWQMNLCRNSQEKGGGMIAHWYSHAYQKPDGWPKMNLPENVVKSFRLGIESAAATELPDGGVRIVLKIDNLSGKERKLTLALSDSAEGKTLAEQPVVLKEGGNEVALTVKGAPSKLTARLRDGEHLVLYQDVIAKKLALLSLVSRYSFYMKEDEAVFRVRTLLPEPEKTTAKLECASQKVDAKGAAEFKLKLPLAKIPEGTCTATVTMYRDGQKVAEASTELVKRPYREHATRINRFSRSLVVDGRPYVPFSPCYVWEEHPGLSGQMRSPEYAAGFIDFWQKRGFKTLDILSGCYKGDPELKAFPVLAKAANEKGMNIMLWTKFREQKQEIWGKLIPVYDQPCVITHRVEDEADLGVPSNELRDFVDAMRPLFPYVPTYMNYTPLGVPSRSADLTPDIMMCDPYLTNAGWGKTVEDVMSDVEAMREPALEMNKPMFVFLIACNIPTHYREITSAEQIAQSYGSICIGATGLSYFINAPSTTPHWNAFMQLNREILSLTDVICSEEDAKQAVASNVKLRVITKKHEGNLYLITCNTDENPAGRISFALPTDRQYGGEAEVMFENRSISLKDGKFSDDFPGHSRHVYKVKVKP